MIRDTVVDTLTRAATPLRVRDVHSRVEQILGSEVSRSSVKNVLHRGSRGHTPLFERTTRGCYRRVEAPKPAGDVDSVVHT